MTLTNEILSGLFRFSGDAVFAVCDTQVAYANSAAQKLFSRDITGEYADRLLSLPELEEGGEAFSSLFLEGEDYPCSMQRMGRHVLVIVPQCAGKAAVPGALVQQMRTTLFSLRVALDRLLNTAGERIEPYGSAVLHGYYALLRQVRHMANVHEITENDTFCRMEPLDLASLTAELITSVRVLTGDSFAELLYDVPEKICPVQGDAEKLEQLLLILLLNSLQNTPREGRICVSLTKKGKQYLLSVTDNGRGIPRERLAGVFAPATEAGLNATGSGLGLFIAQGIARLHGGAVVLESREQKGTRVCLTLPESREIPLRDALPPVAVGPGLLLEELAPVLGNDAYGAAFSD